MTNDELINSIYSGDKKVLAQVYNQYRKEFIGWGQKTFRCSADEAKEAYQLAISIFYENIKTGKLRQIDSSIKAYLFAIGKYKIFEEIRQNARNISDIKMEILYVNEEDGEYKKELEEKFKKVEMCLIQMGEPCKSILELTYFENRSMKYISEKLGYKNTDVAKNQKFKCMQRLKKLVLK